MVDLHIQLFSQKFEEDKKIGQSKWPIILIGHFDWPIFLSSSNFWLKSCTCRSNVRLPNHLSIFTAEAYAILRALQYERKMKLNTTIFTDSYSCLTAIKNQCNHPIINRIQNILYYSRLTFNMCWIPSHCKVFGNK